MMQLNPFLFCGLNLLATLIYSNKDCCLIKIILAVIYRILEWRRAILRGKSFLCSRLYGDTYFIPRIRTLYYGGLYRVRRKQAR